MTLTSFYDQLGSREKKYYNELENDYVEFTNFDNQKVKITLEDSLKSYFFGGQTGSGKTKTAVQIGRLWQRFMAKNTNYDDDFIQYHPKFTTLAEYIKLNHKAILFKDIHAKIDAIRSAKFLILDEMALPFWSESTITILYDLIEHRYQNELQTIFTSNQGFQELEKSLNSKTGRIIELVGLNNCYKFEAKNYRYENQEGLKTQIQLELELLKTINKQAIETESKTPQNESQGANTPSQEAQEEQEKHQKPLIKIYDNKNKI